MAILARTHAATELQSTAGLVVDGIDVPFTNFSDGSSITSTS
jgi:hypothetical protein